MEEKENIKMAVAVAELKTTLANISQQLTQIAHELIKLQEGKASAEIQKQHSEAIQSLQIRNAQIMTIGSLAMVVVPFIIDRILNKYL